MLPPSQAPAVRRSLRRPHISFEPKDRPTASPGPNKDRGYMTPTDRPRDGTTTPRRTPRSTPCRPTPKEIKDDAGSAKMKKTEVHTTEKAEDVNGQDEPFTISAGEGASQLDKQEADSDVLEIDSLTSHRVDKDAATVDFLVTWEGREATWEREYDLQTQAPTAVFEYWDKFESREDATGLDIYHVFKILKRMNPSKGKEPKYLIHWVGYRRKESTWEPESKVKEMAPEELKSYEAKHGAASEASTAQKRPSGRGPGRPRKRVKQVVNGAD